MKLKRSCGVLLHITSLPGKYGIGTIGEEATQFARLLRDAGQTYWQILPIGPVSPAFDFSPYASSSAFAGNHYFISLEELAKMEWHDGNIDKGDFRDEHFINFEKVTRHKAIALERAFTLFVNAASKKEKEKFAEFCEEEKCWLDDYSLFTALSDHFKTQDWTQWDDEIKHREKTALAKWAKALSKPIDYHKFLQFIFFCQWRLFKETCNSYGIKIIGDIPIYINLESSDAWAHPEILQLDARTLKPTFVAGVPPDYFSETGQRWGNPLYRWKNEKGKLHEPTYEWWLKRLRHLCTMVDVVRIDHFRAFEAYWSIPAEEETAVNGKWIKGPGKEFFVWMEKKLGKIPMIAEDLGVITDEVKKLRDELELPGMKILQFAFDGSNDNEYLPHNIENPNCVVYTGTHDNNTTNGWFYGDETGNEKRKYILEYIGSVKFSDFHWQLIRLAYMSTARLVIIPAQDIIGYGEEFRMNKPGTTQGNWRWKLTEDGITQEMWKKLKEMAHLYRRNP
ncbi:MAG: 4-alpha-glucanotransferase [Spirochaetes bacterium]|nr:4-alpha-glucanotransferase [Spirochaetota bacterium]